MKPSCLKPGDRVRFTDSRRILTFIRRERGRPNLCIFEGAELGIVTASDADVIRRCNLAERDTSGADNGR